MSRFQRVLNNLYMTVLISAVFHWAIHPEQGYMLLGYLVRVAFTAVIVYILYWLGDRYEIRRRQ